MTDAVPAPSLAQQNLNAFINIFVHLGTNWHTSLVGMAFTVLGVAGYFGLPLPIVGNVQLTPSELLSTGLGALGLFASKDGNKS